MNIEGMMYWQPSCEQNDSSDICLFFKNVGPTGSASKYYTKEEKIVQMCLFLKEQYAKFSLID